MKKKSNKKDNKHNTKIVEYLKSIGLNPDKSTSFKGPETFLRMKEGEQVIIIINKITYDWYDDYNKETKEVRLDFTLKATTDPELEKYVDCEMNWNSKSPEAKEYFGTIKNQKPVPKMPIVISRVNYSQWTFSGWE